MRIVQVTPRYPPQNGGVEVHVREVSERLVDRGHDVTVHTADRGSGGRPDETREGVRVRRHRGLAPAGAFHVAPGILTAVSRAEADIVHAHNYHSLPLVLAAVGARNRRLVLTPHYHGASASRFRDVLLAAYRPLGKCALRRADAVVAVSNQERERLIVEFGVDAVVVPNGVDVDRFAAADPIVREKPYLLSVGRLEEYKGVQHVIRALGRLPEYELLVAGAGPYEHALRQVARQAGVADRVELLGYVPEETLPGLYAGADVYAALSEFEAFGMTVAEALAAGTPCLVRADSGLDHWLANRGVVALESIEPEVVADGIRRVRHRRPDGTETQAWDDVVDRLEMIYLDEEK